MSNCAGFSGQRHWLSDSRHVLLRSRVLNAVLGTMLTRDSLQYAYQFGTYVYSAGGPVSQRDQLGLCPLPIPGWHPRRPWVPDTHTGWWRLPGDGYTNRCECRGEISVTQFGTCDDTVLMVGVANNNSGNGDCCLETSCKFKFRIGIDIKPADNPNPNTPDPPEFVDKWYGPRSQRPTGFPRWEVEGAEPGDGWEGDPTNSSVTMFAIDRSLSCGNRSVPLVIDIFPYSRNCRMMLNMSFICQACSATVGFMGSECSDQMTGQHQE